MQIEFATPAGAFVGLAVALPFAALLLGELRARRLRRMLGLADPQPRRWAPLVVALALLAALLAAAAAQPAVRHTTSRLVRTDAAGYFVIDTSRSMLASAGPGAPARIARAEAAAAVLRASIPEVPVGIASMTDRVIPHLFPTADEASFASTLAQAIAIEQPPPGESGIAVATTYAALENVALLAYFPPQVHKRLLVVLTDGESRSFSVGSLGRSLANARIQLLFVRFWQPGERVFGPNGAAEPQYRADPRSGATFRALAASLGASSFTERDLGAAAAAERRALGTGPTVREGSSQRLRPIAPWLLVAALAPLSYLLARRRRAAQASRPWLRSAVVRARGTS